LRPRLAALALRTGLARRSLLAALAIGAFASGMALRSSWTLSPTPGYRIIRHARNSLKRITQRLTWQSGKRCRAWRALQAIDRIDQHQSALWPAVSLEGGKQLQATTARCDR
jgi:hypothetical protein